MSPTSFRVIKLGGSLLKTEAVAQFPIWLAKQPEAANVVIVGGGPFVDVIREIDELWGLGDDAAHWLSVRAMGLSAEVVSRKLGGIEIATSLDRLRETPAHLRLLEVEDFLRYADSRCASPLPCRCDVTSDSIAARVAAELAAQELVLLKSCLPTAVSSWPQLAASGFVDAYFPEAVKPLNNVRCVNARLPDWPEMTISPDQPPGVSPRFAVR